MKSKVAILLLFVPLLCANAQSNDFRDRFNSFKKEAESNHNNFRKQCNQAYADFLRETWESYGIKHKEKPKDKMVPPVIYKKPDVPQIEIEPIEENEIDIEIDPALKPDKKLAIAPILNIDIAVEPLESHDAPDEEPSLRPDKNLDIKPLASRFSFTFFGDTLSVRAGEKMKFKVPSPDGNDVAIVWMDITNEPLYEDMLSDCLKIRSEHGYCDWAYLQMIYAMAKSFLKTENEATVLSAWLLCQSGYKIRIASADKDLYLLFGSEYTIYGAKYLEKDGETFYCMGDMSNKELYIAPRCVFPREKSVSFDMSKKERFKKKSSKPRQLQSRRYSEASVLSTVNSNLMRFYFTCPDVQLGDDFMSRWVLRANIQMDETTREAVYPSLEKAIKGKTPLEAVNILLNFVQTAFTYKFDEEVWGYDRVFFPEETFYYDYCDCEDRSILFTRIVRDLLGMDTALVYYPNHLAAAVRFDEEVNGDGIVTEKGTYIITDPTYIGAPVGATMEGMNNSEATIAFLK